MYSQSSNAELIKEITSGNKQVLNEFLIERKLLTIDGTRHILPSYLFILKQNNFQPFIIIFNKNDKLLEQKMDLVYDRTLKKFSNFEPDDPQKTDDGPYCNTYYKKLYDSVSKIQSKNPRFTLLQEEIEIERLFQKFVIKHINYSWKEVLRSTNTKYSRYRWNHNNEALELKRPSWIKADKFKKWLEETFSKKLPIASRGFIQNIIYETYGYGENIDINEHNEWDHEISSLENPLELGHSEYIQNNLYETVADEKAENIEKLKPAIRKLGKNKVKKLVLHILDEFVEDSTKDIDIAREFNLSKATFSRFAGRDWKKNPDKTIPDLWQNIAQVIIKNENFSEFAKGLGIIDIIQKITKRKL